MVEPNMAAAGVPAPQAISHWQNIKTFALGGKFISASFIAAILLGSLPAFGGVSNPQSTERMSAGAC